MWSVAVLLIAIAIVVIGVIAFGPSRQLRAESQLDDEVETRILLHMDPDPASDADEPAPDVVDDERHPKQYAKADVEALEHLDED